MNPALAARRARLAAWLNSTAIDLLVLEDCEERRCSSLAYLSGHPMDALFFLRRDGHAVLVPWDIHLARSYASVDQVVPYGDFKRSFPDAVVALVGELAPHAGAVVELSRATPHPTFAQLETRLAAERPSLRLLCREDGAEAELDRMRQIKDGLELETLREGCRLTNELLAGLEDLLLGPGEPTELDVALYIERQARRLGAEGTGFETIAAGPPRSWGIHAHPAHGAGPFACPRGPGAAGLSILDFGLRHRGYATDVTLTLVSGRTTPRQHLLLDLVAKAYEAAVGACRPGAAAIDVAMVVDEIFGKAGFTMPHSLGHGLGLDVHEPPFFRVRKDTTAVLEPGMVFALEPGLYDPEAGGVRLENDILVTESGCEILTEAKILYRT